MILIIGAVFISAIVSAYGLELNGSIERRFLVGNPGFSVAGDGRQTGQLRDMLDRRLKDISIPNIDEQIPIHIAVCDLSNVSLFKAAEGEYGVLRAYYLRQALFGSLTKQTPWLRQLVSRCGAFNQKTQIAGARIPAICQDRSHAQERKLRFCVSHYKDTDISDRDRDESALANNKRITRGYPLLASIPSRYPRENGRGCRSDESHNQEDRRNIITPVAMLLWGVRFAGIGFWQMLAPKEGKLKFWLLGCIALISAWCFGDGGARPALVVCIAALVFSLASRLPCRRRWGCPLRPFLASRPQQLAISSPNGSSTPPHACYAGTRIRWHIAADTADMGIARNEARTLAIEIATELDSTGRYQDKQGANRRPKKSRQSATFRDTVIHARMAAVEFPAAFKPTKTSIPCDYAVLCSNNHHTLL